MPGIENKITYDTIDSYVLDKIPGFSEFFYKEYDDSDRKIKYEVFGSLVDFFRQNYHDNSKVIENITDTLQEIFLSNSKELRELVLAGFIENLLEEDKNKMNELRLKLKHKELQDGLDGMYHDWYEI